MRLYHASFYSCVCRLFMRLSLILCRCDAEWWCRWLNNITIQTHNTYTSTYACRTQRHNEDERHSPFRKKYTYHFIWKTCVWEGVRDRTELQHIDPHSYGHQRFFPVLLISSNGGMGLSLSGCWFSLLHLISNCSGLQTNWLTVFTELYNSSSPTLLSWASQISLIQPIHGQGYTLLFFNRITCYLYRCISYFDRPPGRRSIYNNLI